MLVILCTTLWCQAVSHLSVFWEVSAPSPHTGDAAASAITARWKTWHVGSHQFLATILMIWEMLQQTKAETFYYYYSSYTTTESVTLCER